MGYKVINKRNELVDLYSDFSGEINPGITKVRCDIGLAQNQKYSEQIITLPNILSNIDAIPLIGEFSIDRLGAAYPSQIGMEMRFVEDEPTELHIYLGRDGSTAAAVNGYVVVYFFSGDVVRNLKMLGHLFGFGGEFSGSCTDQGNGYHDVPTTLGFYTLTTSGVSRGVKILGIGESFAFDNNLRTSPGFTCGIEGFVNEYGSLAGRIKKYTLGTILGARDIENIVALTTHAEESYVVRSDKALIPLYKSDNKGVIRFIDFDVATTPLGIKAMAIIPIPFNDVDVNCIALAELKFNNSNLNTIPQEVYYDSNLHSAIITISALSIYVSPARQIKGTIVCFTEG